MLSYQTIEDRIAHLDKFEDFIRKRYKSKLAQNHPDLGGDVVKYKLIRESFDIIIAAHNEYKAKMIRDWEQEEIERSKKVFIRFK